MNDLFKVRVRGAAAAAWWTCLIGIAFLILQWILYLIVMSSRPAWALTLWGQGASWDSMRAIWFWGLAFVKISLWMVALAALWLTLWSRQLRKT